MFGLISGAIDGAVNRGHAKEMQARAHKFSKHMFKHRYRYTVNDMERAGVNPVLAFASGANAGSAPSGAGGAPGNQDLAGARMKFSAAQLAKEHNKQAKEATRKLDAEADIAEHQEKEAALRADYVTDALGKQAMERVWASEGGTGEWALRGLYQLYQNEDVKKLVDRYGAEAQDMIFGIFDAMMQPQPPTDPKKADKAKSKREAETLKKRAAGKRESTAKKLGAHGGVPFGKGGGDSRRMSR